MQLDTRIEKKEIDKPGVIPIGRKITYLLPKGFKDLTEDEQQTILNSYIQKTLAQISKTDITSNEHETINISTDLYLKDKKPIKQGVSLMSHNIIPDELENVLKVIKKTIGIQLSDSIRKL